MSLEIDSSFFFTVSSDCRIKLQSSDLWSTLIISAPSSAQNEPSRGQLTALRRSAALIRVGSLSNVPAYSIMPLALDPNSDRFLSELDLLHSFARFRSVCDLRQQHGVEQHALERLEGGMQFGIDLQHQLHALLDRQIELFAHILHRADHLAHPAFLLKL